MAIRYSTLVKRYGKPIPATSVTDEEYEKADEENRIVTIFDNGVQLIGGHRTVDVSYRFVIPNKPNKDDVGNRVLGSIWLGLEEK